MIPRKMDAYLREHIPVELLQSRTRRREGRCHLVLGYRDEHLLGKLGIVCDALGPKLVVCVWDESAAIEVGGYLVVDNLAMGSPSMGGIRMLPEITPADIHNLARGMTLKNAAANLPFGGGKAGIVADPGLPGEARTELVRRFARLIRRYRDIYVPGPDVGTNDADMKTIAVENGLEASVSKPAEMGGNRGRGCPRRASSETTAADGPRFRCQRSGGLSLRSLRVARRGTFRPMEAARPSCRALVR